MAENRPTRKHEPLRFVSLTEFVQRRPRRVERWVPVHTTRNFFSAYAALGMHPSQFEELGNSNVWVSKQGHFRVRVARDDETERPDQSARVVEVRLFIFEEASR